MLLVERRMNIVSGFISNVNQRSDRDITKYLNFGFELMAVEIPMTIFIEKPVFDANILPRLSSPYEFGEFTYRTCGGVMDGIQKTYSFVVIGHITFLFFDICDLFLWSSRFMARKFALNTGNPSKDTLEYMMVQCQKSEWMAIATQLHKQHKEYVWIDFGVFHMFQGKIDVFQTELYNLRGRVNIRISQSSKQLLFARCWDPSHHHYYGDIYKDVNWLFAGSVFGGGTDAINQFALKMREKCFQILRERNTLMWEINIWTIIYKENPELFSFYPSDHSEIIFRKYS
jgi:hypothetical protein